MSPHGPPPGGTREQLHVHDLVIALAEIEDGDLDGEVTPELLTGYPPVPREQAVSILTRLQDAVASELARATLGAPTPAPKRRRAPGHPVFRLARA